MTKQRIAKLAAAAALLVPMLGACKEDPPPPPLPEPARSGKAAGNAKGKTNAKNRFADARVPKISPATTKAYRVESCYFGAMGLRVARDAYIKSMGGAEPGPNKIPEFGDYPENIKLAEAAKKRAAAAKKRDAEAAKRGAAGVPNRRPMVGPTPQIPFLRHLQSCRVSKTMKEPAIEGLDQAIADFEQYVSPLQRTLLDAHRYYSRKRFEKDDFKRSKKLHETLVKGFAELDTQLAAFQGAVDSWRAKRPAPTEKLDEGGVIAQGAIDDARALTLLLIAETVDAGAVTESLEKLRKAHEELKGRAEGGRKEVFAKFVPPKLEVFIEAAAAASKLTGKLAPVQTYPVTAALTAIIEANHRALGQLLRRRGDTKDGRPTRLVNPSIKPGVSRPRIRPLKLKPGAEKGE